MADRGARRRACDADGASLPKMTDRLVFLTGHLALPRLEKVLGGMPSPPFDWAIVNIGVKVAALMTEAIISRRLPRPVMADRVILPGRCRADLAALSAQFGVAFERGPDELNDLAAYLGAGGRPPDLSRHDIRIFAEIVDASARPIEAILARAREMTAAGADVIDLGCLPDTPFPHLEEAIGELKRGGFQVSVDSADREELARGARAGADYLLSLTEETLDIAAESGSTPVLIPAQHGDLVSLLRAAEEADRRGIACLLDPI
ncbi:MAG: dihydropteroate synthase, partial [Methylobacteriaceae bacterium]|nr:dihydropteroate synthase [Methylobacteriaceae bacterium]